MLMQRQILNTRGRAQQHVVSQLSTAVPGERQRMAPPVCHSSSTFPVS